MRTKSKPFTVATGAATLVIIALAAWHGWPRLRFWYDFERLSRNAQGYIEYRHRQTGMVMVRLPGGKFWMGAQKTDLNGRNNDPEALPNEAPVHEVTLTPFLIGKYEVTQGQWKAELGSNPASFHGGDDRPVEQVSWEDIQAFEKKTGLRLPTEAQWEYACRGGTPTPFAGTGKLDEMGWYQKNSGRTTHLVGQKASNQFGLYDMHGNVWEWCEDKVDYAFYGRVNSFGPDPISMAGSDVQVFRGGGWRVSGQHCRSAYRSGAILSFRDNFLGFRAAYWPLP